MNGKKFESLLKKLIIGRIGRTAATAAATIAFGTFTVACIVTQADEAVSLFGSDLETPFLTTAVDESLSPAVGEADPIESRFLQMQHELDQLKTSLDVNSKTANAAKELASKSAVPAPVVYPTAKLTGFFQADAGWFHQDANSVAEFAAVNPPNGDIQDNRGFRRARLAGVGKVADNVSYMLEMDFAFPGRPTFMDVWLDIAKVPGLGNVRIGQFRQPFGMDELTSVKELTFLERPVTQPMGPFRQIGAEFYDHSIDENVTWAASAFGTGTDQFGNSFGDSGYGMASRITAVAAEDKSADFLLHTGFGYSFINNPNHDFEYRNNPEYVGPITTVGPPPTGVGVPFFTDTGLIQANNANLFNGELASTWGSWHAQSELRYNLLNQDAGHSVGYPSFYAQSGYILTGEHRPYNKANAVLGRIKPKNPVGKCGGLGAWELACRYSWVDLNEAATIADTAGIINPNAGGQLNNITYGLNWYLNDFTKMQFNYISSDLNRGPIGDSHTDIFAVRAQLDF